MKKSSDFVSLVHRCSFFLSTNYDRSYIVYIFASGLKKVPVIRALEICLRKSVRLDYKAIGSYLVDDGSKQNSAYQSFDSCTLELFSRLPSM